MGNAISPPIDSICATEVAVSPQKRNAIATIVSGSVVVMLLTPATAQAQYLDPGAGSIIVQAVIAVMVGATAAVKIYWGKISGFLNRRAKSKSQY
jgi:hypothetical protein